MRILALDQATVTGWAVGDDKAFQDRKVEFGRFKVSKRAVLGERLLIFGNSLRDRIEFYKPELIAYERVFVPAPNEGKFVDGKWSPPDKPKIPYNPDTMSFLLKIAGILGYVAADMRIPVEEYASASWRKSFLGHGRVDDPKKAARLRAKQLGYDVEIDDESDAIGILFHALHGPPGSARAQADLLSLVDPL